MLVNILWIALGGAAGSVLRYLISVVVPAGSGVPWGTLTVNVAGSMLIGVALANISRGETGHFLGVIGFCGGFTTFSTFSAELLGMIREGDYGVAAAYAAASIVVCVVAVGVGLLVKFR